MATEHRLEVWRLYGGGHPVDYFPVDSSVASLDVARSAVKCMPNDGREHLVAVALDVHGKPLAWRIVSSGTVDAVMLYPRDVFAFALSVPRVRFVAIAHNHPSGDVTPSGADKSGTGNMIKAGKIIGLDVLWSIVVTHESDAWALIEPPKEQYGKGGQGDDAQPQGQKPEGEGEGEGEGEPEGDPDDAEGIDGAAVPQSSLPIDGEDVSVDELRKLLKKAIGGGVK